MLGNYRVATQPVTSRAMVSSIVLVRYELIVVITPWLLVSKQYTDYATTTGR
jgi:hypothetical protein